MNRLKQLREERELLQRDVAAYLDISTAAYGFYETEARSMSAETAKKLAEFFNVTVDYLLGADNKNKNVIPILGTVKAGYNHLANQDIIDYINPYMDITEYENYFGLLVKGNSMSPHFNDGDYVVVHKTDGCFESGKICVVLINGEEATIKKVVKTKDGIELRAFNPYYPMQKYTFKEIKELKIQIIGVVENQIRHWK